MTEPALSPLDAEDLRERVNKTLGEFIERQRPRLDEVSEDLDAVVQSAHAILSGGKRLRPAFAYWGWRAGGGTDSDIIVTAATSLELLQACALIHDDVMDGSDSRRGQPSVHRRFATLHRGSGWLGSADSFGAGAAILLGDLTLAWADELLFTSGLPVDSLVRAKPVYDRMRTELMAGQYLDLLEQARGGGSVERALRVARYKAAKYTVEGPLHLGAAMADAKPGLLQVLSAYGLPLGEAFQLRDDLLGVFGDPDRTGKPAGDDLREGKRTVLIAFAHEHATSGQRDDLRRYLGDPHLSGAGVSALRELITETGAHARVEALIDDLTQAAVLAVDAVDEPARSVLVDLAAAATSRRD
jgi:geranylgeranyl diphosphate synthase type I